MLTGNRPDITENALTVTLSTITNKQTLQMSYGITILYLIG